MKYVIGLLTLGLALNANASEVPLEEQMKLLDSPVNQLPAGVTVDSEKYYSVQSRYVPLRNRSEIDLNASQLLNGNGFLNTSQFGAAYRFHFNDNWNLSAHAAWMNNARSAAGDRLFSQEDILPDAAYLKNRYDLLLTRNLFYGKFRLTMDQVFYFDQFISLGGGYVNLDRNSSPEAVADIGFGFWMGRTGALRVGMKNYVYREQRRITASIVHDMNAYLELGLLLGKGSL